MTAAREIPYRPRRRSAGLLPGAHRGAGTGGLGPFRDSVPFLRHPDPRRIDLRATLRDPAGEVHVRRFEQPAALALYLLADLSASMGFVGRARKMDLLADLYAGLGTAAGRFGDALGLVGCDTAVRPDFLVPARRGRGGDAGIAARLRGFVPTGPDAGGLAEAAVHLGGRPRLVVLASDFYLPLDRIAAVLASLARHDVAPVMLVDSAEDDALPFFQTYSKLTIGSF